VEIDDIKAEIKGGIGREIFFYETVGSTNTVASDLAEKTIEGAVVIADSQQKGRGRLGRKWESPPGVNIYMSIILRPKIESKEEATLITIMAAVACATALRRVTGLHVTIKWPNDLMVSDKKIGGILSELKTDHGRIIYAVVGIGINVNVDIDTYPADVQEVATSVRNETGMSYSREVVISKILNEIDYWYKILNGMGKGILLLEWQKLTSTLGREVKVTVGKETFAGLAESIDSEGMLILRLPSGMLKKINSGDLTILR
jgi:BirA family biotin operon repressor/biotin-[acetyl-CoA-carboxylase] ligase